MGILGKGRAPYRVAAAVASSALAIVGLTVTAPGAQSSVALRAQFTSSVSSPATTTSPVTATVDKAIALDFLMTNTSTFFAPMGKFTVTAPAGFTLSLPTIDRSGWSATISGQSLTGKITRPITLVGLPPGQSLHLGVTATPIGTSFDPNAISTSTTWPVKGYGFLGLLPFTLQGPSPIVNVVGAGTAAFAALPNVPLNNIAAPGSTGGDCALGSTNPICSEATLPQGANGNVYFLQRTCVVGTDLGCGVGIEAELSANFGTGSGALLSNTSPGHFDVTCIEAECTHREPGSSIGTREDEPSTNYDYNFTCSPLSRCGTNFAEREVEEDFGAYPVFVKLKGQTTFTEAPRCVAVNDLITTGQIIAEPAATLHFCVDVNAISRTGNAFTGDLTLPVLFSEDITVRTTKK